MAYTPVEYFKYDPERDQNETFSITKALNENWDKTDAAFSELNTSKVEVEEGKGLSSNDYTDEDKQKVSEIENKIQEAVNASVLQALNASY